MAYLNHSLPDWSVYIRNEFLYNHKKGHGEVTKCDIHSVASIEKRVPLFEAFLENGVNWTRRPLHAFCWKPDAKIEPLEDIMYWDCFSPYIDVQRRNRLAGLDAELIRPDGKKVIGTYMFTLDWAWENKGIPDLNFSDSVTSQPQVTFTMGTRNYNGAAAQTTENGSVTRSSVISAGLITPDATSSASRRTASTTSC